LDLVLVGIGGVFGGICRFQFGKAISQKANTSFPIGTFLINISGALLLGILTSIDSGNSSYLLLGDGFCGAFTTFSTFMYEGFNLFQENDKLNAFTYILSTLLLGIIGYVCGYMIGKTIVQF